MLKIVLYYCLLTVLCTLIYSETLSEDNVNPSLLVHHYDCRERLNVRRFSLNRVDNCHISQNDIETSPANVQGT